MLSEPCSDDTSLLKIHAVRIGFWTLDDIATLVLHNFPLTTASIVSDLFIVVVVCVWVDGGGDFLIHKFSPMADYSLFFSVVNWWWVFNVRTRTWILRMYGGCPARLEYTWRAVIIHWQCCPDVRLPSLVEDWSTLVPCGPLPEVYELCKELVNRSKVLNSSNLPNSAVSGSWYRQCVGVLTDATRCVVADISYIVCRVFSWCIQQIKR